MNREKLEALILDIFERSAENLIPGVGCAIYERPLIGIAAADDPLFEEYKRAEVVGPWHMSPDQWLDGAKAVVSLFFPFSEGVRRAHRQCGENIAFEWLYARVEGQALLDDIMRKAAAELELHHIKSIVPAIDSRFKAIQGGKGGITGYAEINEQSFGSTWSERHAAYACGLGTFGLSKGIITEKGMAGRFASIIIDFELPADPRPYTGIYDYCTKCGACICRCPVNAISLERGKDHSICGPWIDRSKQVYAPRYGCGLCQTSVPCESRRPVKKL